MKLELDWIHEGKRLKFPSAGGPLPRFDEIEPPSHAAPNAAPPPLQPQQSGGPIRVPPLTPDKVSHYSALFEESGARNGVLSGMELWIA